MMRVEGSTYLKPRPRQMIVSAALSLKIYSGTDRRAGRRKTAAAMGKISGRKRGRQRALWRWAPRPHVREIQDHQLDLAVAHLVRREAGHSLLGPAADRFRVADQRVQPGAREVLGRVHRLVQVGADRACAGAVEGMAGEALGDQEGLARAHRVTE